MAQALDGWVKKRLVCARVVARRDAGAVDVDAGHEEVIGLKAERLMEQNVDAGDSPSGPGDEHKGEGDLRGDEDAAGAAEAAAARGCGRPPARSRTQVRAAECGQRAAG